MTDYYCGKCKKIVTKKAFLGCESSDCESISISNKMIELEIVEKEMAGEIEQLLINILYVVEERIINGYEEGIFDPNKMSPKDVIVMVATNIIVNFMGKALQLNEIPSNGVKSRIDIMERCLDEVKNVSMKLWKTVETARADCLHSH